MRHRAHMGWNCVIGSAAKCTRPGLLRRCSGSSGAHDMKLTTVGGSATNAAATERSACASGGSPAEPRDRKSVVEGKSVSARVDLGGRRIIKKKKQDNYIKKGHERRE